MRRINFPSPKFIKHKISRFFYYMLWACGTAAFYNALYLAYERSDVWSLAVLLAPTLTVLFGFTSLLYNRARALPQGREQLRSLYAAERSMQATVLFFIGSAVGGLGAALAYAYGSSKLTFPTFLFMSGLLIVLYAFGCFFFAFRTVSHKLFQWVSMRKMARSVRGKTK